MLFIHICGLVLMTVVFTSIKAGPAGQADHVIDFVTSQGTIENSDVNRDESYSILYRIHLRVQMFGRKHLKSTPQTIRLFTNEFELDPDEQYLRLNGIEYTGSGSVVGSLQALTIGTLLTFTSMDQYLDLLFITNGQPSTPVKGFKLQYTLYTGDPCETYLTRSSDHYRSSNYEKPEPPVYDDYELPYEWYRFDSCAGTEVYTQAPQDIWRCGTKYPIWLSIDAMPPIGIEAIGNACVKMGSSENCSDAPPPLQIPVRKCADEFYIYLLASTPARDMGYCVGEGLQCDPSKNESSVSGCLPCVDGISPVIEEPTMTLVPHLPDTHHFAMQCSMKSTEEMSLEWEVKWFVEKGHNTRNIHTETVGPAVGEAISLLLDTHLEGWMGSHVGENSLYNEYLDKLSVLTNV